jgi:hypothetical protein
MRLNLKKHRVALLMIGLYFTSSYPALAQQQSLLENQTVIGPSPTAASLGKYVDNPISYFTGTPSISIPLAEINEKDFNLPIRLNYHPGGIKVDETPSNIGLGWSLEAGGVITRSVKDVPDDRKKANCPEGFWGHWNGVTGDKPDCATGLFYGNNNIHDVDLLYLHHRDTLTAKQQNIGGNYSLNNFFRKYFFVYFNNVNPSLDLPYSPNPVIMGNTMPRYAIYSKFQDTEPDIFYFNFCGKSGKFVFEVINGTRTIKLLSDNDLTIDHSVDMNGQLVKFVVRDDNGNIYEFSDLETTKNVTHNYSYSDNFDPVVVYFDMAETFNSSWYLSKIITSQNHIINLSYTNEEYEYLNQVPAQTVIPFSGADTYNPQTDYCSYPTIWNLNIIKGKRLTTINGTHTRVNFTGGFPREDLKTPLYPTYNHPSAITGIEVNYLEDRLVKKIKFTHDYFESPYEQHHSDHDIYFKRLRLRNIQEIGDGNCLLPATTFEYKYDGFPGYGVGQRLPRRLSFQQDLWGYYNGASDNVASMIPKIYVYPDLASDSRRFSVQKRVNFTGPEYTLPGGDRLPNPALLDIGVLTKINYPTGGSTTYEYEPHKYKDINDEFIGGGLRIKKIIKKDGLSINNNIVYNYSYETNGQSTGRAFSIPIFAVFHNDDYIGAYPAAATQSSYRGSVDRFSLPKATLGTTQGSPIAYRKVIEYINGNGKTEYEFSMPANWYNYTDALPPATGADCSLEENGTCDALYTPPMIYTLFPYTFSPGPSTTTVPDYPFKPLTSNIFPFPENPNYDWNRGYLLGKKYYNETGDLLKSEDLTYKVLYRNGNTAPSKVYGLKFGVRHFRVRVSKYFYLTDVRKVPATKTITEYDPETGKTLTSTEQFSYESQKHAQITKIVSNTSSGDELISQLKYPLDYVTTGLIGLQEGMAPLKLKNMNAIPVEKSVFLKRGNDTKLKSASLSSYGFVGNYVPVLKREFRLENTLLENNFTPSYTTGNNWELIKDSRYIEQNKVIRHDSVGNPLEILTKGGETISYIWGYNNGQYPIAKIVNATYAQIENILSNSVLSHLFKGYQLIGTPQQPVVLEITDQQVRNYINQLRTTLPSSQISTYTYKPLVGISSETAPNGIITYYEYDCFNRLTIVKDQSGKILKQNTYAIQQP